MESWLGAKISRQELKVLIHLTVEGGKNEGRKEIRMKVKNLIQSKRRSSCEKEKNGLAMLLIAGENNHFP